MDDTSFSDLMGNSLVDNYELQCNSHLNRHGNSEIRSPNVCPIQTAERAHCVYVIYL